MTAGLTNMQARMYVSVLQLGEATASELGKHSGINRVTCYVTLNELLELHLINEDEYDLVKKFRPTGLQYLDTVFMKRAKTAIHSYRQVQALIPELSKIAHRSIAVPKTSFHEGSRAVEAYLDGLEMNYLLGAYLLREDHYELIRGLVKRAADANIRPRVLVPSGLKVNLLVYLDHRVIPDKTAHFPSTTLLFEDRMVSILNDDDMVQLFVVEDMRISKQYLDLFELTWRVLSGQRILIPQVMDISKESAVETN